MARDEAPITQAVREYFEGRYDVHVARTNRALCPELAKRSLAECGGVILAGDLMLQACSEGRETRAVDGREIADARWLPE
jgi:hypothetical protein